MFFRKLFCLILLFMKKKKETILNTNRKDGFKFLMKRTKKIKSKNNFFTK